MIDIFAPVNTATTLIAASAQPEVVAAQQVGSTSLGQSPVVQDVASPELNGANVDNTEAETPTASPPPK